MQKFTKKFCDVGVLLCGISTLFVGSQLYAEEGELTKPARPEIEKQIGSVDVNSIDGLSSYDSESVLASKLIGWASVSQCGSYGTTGGGVGSPSVTVTNVDELQAALAFSGPTVIAVDGEISSLETIDISDISDKTLIGRNNAIISGGVRFSRARNLIVKNIEFAAGSNDTVELSKSECIWFDHNTFRDGADGNLDIVRGSNYVTVSWSRFYYTVYHAHMFSNLSGNSDDLTSDQGKINVTMHHNWWGAGVKERMPRVRYGQNHIFNNYYAYEPVPGGDSGQNYVVGAGFLSQMLVENNYFDGSRHPIRFIADQGTAEVVQRGNAFVNITGQIEERGQSFMPPYNYTMDDAEDVPALVRAGAGPRKE